MSSLPSCTPRLSSPVLPHLAAALVTGLSLIFAHTTLDAQSKSTVSQVKPARAAAPVRLTG
ncbi:MAG TPA: hypothetical protein VML00_03710, partial [Bacteroidota bacterium]|nr:hypothetical protein [Bacteroidota bacterium]